MKSKFAIALIASLLSSYAYAQLSEQQQAIWQLLDADQNGYVSQQEAQEDEMVSSLWQDLDADGDGQLTTEEFTTLEVPAAE